MSANLMRSLAELANLKQLNRDELSQIIKEGLKQAIAKKLTSENNLNIIADYDTNRIEAHFDRIVTEHDYNLGDISLADAKRINPNLELGDKVPTIMSILDFEPKVIRNARKAILERIKLMEESRIIDDYEAQKHQIVSGKVRKEDYNGYIISLGYTDALLPKDEQIENEYFKVGDIVRAFVIDIKKRKNDVVVILSRTHPAFVKKILEMEIPEITSGDVTVKKIVREPGIRSKVAVISNTPGLDATACCLGPKGIRIEQVRAEVYGELVDIVEWDESPEQLIANAIGPDLVEKVYLAERGKFARIIVRNENKNLAIGKQGKNVKLAAKLTDYKLDIFTQEEFEDKIAEERRITSHISDLDGMSAHLLEVLKEHGYTSVQDIYEASVEELTNMEGMGKKTAEKLKESARYF